MHDFATDNAPDALPRASSRRNWIAFFVALLVITGLIHSRTTRFWGRLFAGILGGPYVIGWAHRLPVAHTGANVHDSETAIPLVDAAHACLTTWP